MLGFIQSSQWLSACPPQSSRSLFILFYFIFCFLGPRPQHVEVPRLRVEWELQLPTYAAATATSDPSRICDLHHSSRGSLTPWAKAGMEPASSRFLVGFVNHWAMKGAPPEFTWVSLSGFSFSKACCPCLYFSNVQFMEEVCSESWRSDLRLFFSCAFATLWVAFGDLSRYSSFQKWR